MSTMKRRTIIVDNMSCASCEDKIRDELGKMNGIREIQIDRQNGEISVLYDLMKTDLEKIEQKVEDIGYTIHKSFFGNIKDKYVHFTEENERDTLNAPPMPCCSHPDSILEKKK